MEREQPADGQSPASIVLDHTPEPRTMDVAAELPVRQQTLNLIWFAVITFLIYLSAPVLYVDMIHAALCDKLGAGKAVANLPSSAAIFLALIAPVIVWAAPHTRWVVPMLLGLFGLLAVIGAIMAVLLMTVEDPTVIIVGTIAYGGLAGLALLTAGMYRWEALARGVSEQRRGWVFAISFGIGPLFAVLGSSAAHIVLSGGVEWLGLSSQLCVAVRVQRAVHAGSGLCFDSLRPVI